MTMPLAIAWDLLFSSLCSFPGAFRQGELLPDQPSPQEHSPAHTRGSTGPGQTPIAGKEQKSLISFPFSPLAGVPQCLPSSPVHPAFCRSVAVPSLALGAAGAQTPPAEAAAMQPVVISPGELMSRSLWAAGFGHTAFQPSLLACGHPLGRSHPCCATLQVPKGATQAK